MGLNSALQIVGDAGVEFGIFALDDVDMPGHGVTLPLSLNYSPKANTIADRKR